MVFFHVIVCVINDLLPSSNAKLARKRVAQSRHLADVQIQSQHDGQVIWKARSFFVSP